MRLMTVGDAAKAAGVSPKAIRHWEARGLITPLNRTRTGYRTFSESDIDLLRFIRQAKSLGLTLSEIREILHLTDEGSPRCERVTRMIDAHLVRIEETLGELNHLHDALTRARSRTRPTPFAADDTLLCPIIQAIDTPAT